MTRLLTVLLAVLLLAGCSRTAPQERTWVDDEVTFEADGLTLHGTYHHFSGDTKGPAALLISESGVTDRNGDNNVAGPIGNMRQLGQFLSDHGVATLRYDKVGTGKTGLGPHAERPADVGTAVFTAGAKSAVRFLAGQAGTDPARISVYALGEGTMHAMALAGDTAPGAPKIHSLALLQPLNARYLDLITDRVKADMASSVRTGAKTQRQADEVLAAWTAAVAQVRASGTVAAKLPEGLSAIVNPGKVDIGLNLKVRRTGKCQGGQGGRRDRPPRSGRAHPRRNPGAADLFGLRRPVAVLVGHPAGRRIGARRPRSGAAQGRQPCAARRSHRQHRQLRQAGSAVSSADRRAGRVRGEVIA